MDIISNAISYITTLYEPIKGSHDLNHTLRVYKTSLLLAENKKDINYQILSLASLFHDIDDPKIFNSSDNANARNFLKENNVKEEEKIIKVINEISFSKNKNRKPTSIEAMIIQDADRLEAIGAIGIARTFSYGGEKSRAIEESIKHFDDKLLLLKDLMNTKEAKKLALSRHKFLVQYLKQYKKEINYIYNK